jgi:hypothetical protein
VIPSFEELDVQRALLYSTGGSTIPTLILNREDDEQAELLAMLTQAYLNGTRVSYPSFYTQQASYTMRFDATNLPDLYYCISYIEYEEDVFDEIDGVEVNLGRYFLYDRYNKICVAVDASLHNALRGQ